MRDATGKLCRLNEQNQPTEFLTSTAIADRLHNLPVPANPLIGRDPLLAEAVKLLSGSKTRLLTLTGPAGTGKTRFAYELARELAYIFTDGVYFVPLTDIRSESNLVLFELTRVLCPEMFKEQVSISILEFLESFIKNKKMLLVLDNFEQVLEASPYISDLLSVTPELKVIVTSRVNLRLYYEYNFPIPPLEIPPSNPLPPINELMNYSTFQLFIERARNARPELKISSTDAGTIVEICKRLDGLPLAIELAAARVSYFPLDTILKRLINNRFTLLTGGYRDKPVHQQTLLNTIEWSYDLLDSIEQKIFRWLGIFVGDFSLTAAITLCEELGISEDELLKIVFKLIDSNLLVLQKYTDEPRLKMLETIREYAIECLKNAGELSLAYQMHLNFYLQMVVVAENELRGGPNVGEWIDKLDLEQSNFRVALEWALTENLAEIAIRLCNSLGKVWFFKFRLAEGLQWFDKVFQIADENVSSSLMAPTLNVAGNLCFRKGDFEIARNYYEKALTLYRLENNETGIASVLSNLGVINSDLFNHIKAIEYFLESLAIYRKLQLKWNIANNQCNLGLAYFYINDFDKALECLQENSNYCQELGDSKTLAMSWLNLGRVYAKKGEWEKAVDLILQSAAEFNVLQEKQFLAECFCEIALSSINYKKYPWAAQLWGLYNIISQEAGTKLSEADRNYYDPIGKICIEKLGEPGFNQLVEEGAKLDIQEVLNTIKAELLKPVAAVEYPNGLTESEVKILRLLAKGFDDDQIADQLGYSKSNVSNTLSRIYDKIGANEPGLNRRTTSLLFVQKNNLLEQSFQV